jgi:hypothetical protein
MRCEDLASGARGERLTDNDHVSEDSAADYLDMTAQSLAGALAASVAGPHVVVAAAVTPILARAIDTVRDRSWAMVTRHAVDDYLGDPQNLFAELLSSGSGCELILRTFDAAKWSTSELKLLSAALES